MLIFSIIDAVHRIEETRVEQQDGSCSTVQNTHDIVLKKVKRFSFADLSDAFVFLCQSGQPNIRHADYVLEAIRSFEDSRKIQDLLLENLNCQNAHMKNRVVRALGDFQNEHVRSALTRQFQMNISSSSKMAIIQMLAKYNDVRSKKLLIGVISNSGDVVLATAALELLGEYEDAVSAIDEVIDAHVR